MNDSRRLVEQEGVSFFTFRSAELGCLVRPISTHDKGVDAELEICDSFSYEGHKPILGVQVKLRTEAKKLENGKYSIAINESSLNYWHKYGRPIILVLYDKSTAKLYWERVDKAEQKQIHIDSNNEFNKDAIPELVGFCKNYALGIIKCNELVEFDPVLKILGDNYKDISEPLVDRIRRFYGFFDTNDFDNACNMIRPIAEIYNQEKPILLNCITAFCQKGDSDALIYVNQLLEVIDFDHNHYGVCGSCYAQFGMYTEAIVYLEKSLSLKDCLDFKNNYAMSLYNQKDYDRANVVLLEVLEGIEFDSKIYFNYALILTGMKKYAEAINTYLYIIENDPGFSDAYNNAALMYKSLGYHGRACNLFSLGLSKCENNYYMMVNYAGILKDYGKDALALNFYLKAKKERDEPYVLREIAMIYCREGDFPTAGDIFTKYYDAIFGSLEGFDKNKETAIVDCGFEVLYFCLLRKDGDKVSVSKFVNNSENSLFNHFRNLARDKGIPFEVLKFELLSGNAEEELSRFLGK